MKTEREIDRELEILVSVFKLSESARNSFKKDLVNMLELNEQQQNAQIILSLQFLVEGQDKFLFDLSIAKVNEFVELTKQIEPWQNVREISTSAIHIKEVVGKIEKQNKDYCRLRAAKVGALFELSKSRDLFFFALSQKDVNFNDLYECLDD